MATWWIFLVALISGTYGEVFDIKGGPGGGDTCEKLEVEGLTPENIGAPFKIYVNNNEYEPRKKITVTISLTGSTKIRGFVIAARKQNFPNDPALGIGYLEASSEEVQQICQTTIGNALYLVRRQPADPWPLGSETSIDFTWMPPDTNEGYLRIYASIWADDGRFWLAEESQLLHHHSVSPPTTTTRKPYMVQINLDECGKTKGCYRNPAGCTQDCELLMTWQEETDGVVFELTGSSSGWIALGLSEDKYMGKDDVYECVRIPDGSDMVQVHQSRNLEEGNRNIQLDPSDTGLTVLGSQYMSTERIITCKFKKLRQTDDNFFNLRGSYHLLMAKGKMVQDGPNSYKKGRHNLEPHKNPYVSKRKVMMRDKVDINGTTRYALVKLHGVLMLLAFMLCSPVAIMMAKYYKLMWPNDRLCGERVWFAVHRGCQVVTLVAAILGFILIFIHAGGYSQMPDLPDRAHPIIGIIVTILVIVNPLISLCRCNPKSSKRPIFNWFHWFFGTIAIVLAVVNIFIGLNLPKAFFPWWGTWVLVFFYLFHLVIELMHEIHGCINGRKQKRLSEEFEMTRRGFLAPKGEEPDPVGVHFKRRILAVYLVVAIICFILVIIALAVG